MSWPEHAPRPVLHSDSNIICIFRHLQSDYINWIPEQSIKSQESPAWSLNQRPYRSCGEFLEVNNIIQGSPVSPESGLDLSIFFKTGLTIQEVWFWTEILRIENSQELWVMKFYCYHRTCMRCTRVKHRLGHVLYIGATNLTMLVIALWAWSCCMSYALFRCLVKNIFK